MMRRFVDGDYIKASELPVFDAAEHLKTEEDIAAYLAIVHEENDPAALEEAHATVARARVIAQDKRTSTAERGDLPPA